MGSGSALSRFQQPRINAAFDNVEEQVTSFEGVRGKLKPDMEAEAFLEVVRVSESMSRLVNQIYAFAGLSFAEDTQNQNAQTMIARVQQFVRRKKPDAFYKCSFKSYKGKECQNTKKQISMR